MNWKEITSFISGCIASVCGTFIININEILGLIIQIAGVLGALASLVIAGWNIFDKIKAAYKNDGKIDDKEKESIQKDIKDALDDFKDDLK
jgi:hypothetical protein